MQVQLLKKSGKYLDKDGNEKNYVNFYIRCGDSLIPIEPCFFPDKDNDNKDYQYAGRKEVLKAFADILPDKDKSAGNSSNDKKRGNKPRLQSFDDDSDIPFLTP